MIESLIYDGLVFACWLYAMLRGGAPERICASILFFGSALTYAAVSEPAVRFASVEAGVFVVDVAALLGFMIVALCAERFWPLWITALQIIGTAGHAVKLVDPHVLRWGYAFALAFWSYPMLALLIAATWNHQKRLRLHGVDKSWSSFSGRWGLGRRLGPPAS
jgi:hypothetical protein